MTEISNDAPLNEEKKIQKILTPKKKLSKNIKTK